MESALSPLTDVLERLSLENGSGRLQQLHMLQVRVTGLCMPHHAQKHLCMLCDNSYSFA